MMPPVVPFGMRIVLDTASLIMALRSRYGAAAEVLRLILRGKVVALMDYKLSMEYRDVALRPEHLAASGLLAEEVITIIESLESVAEPTRIERKPRPLSPDPNDDMVLDIAINVQADMIVTNNKKHFNAPAMRFGIAVLSPQELLETLSKER